MGGGAREDGAAERDGSQWVNPKALTPGGFDAIFPRREPTCEELVNNICPGSGEINPPHPPALPHTHICTVLLSIPTSVPPLRTGLPRLDRPH